MNLSRSTAIAALVLSVLATACSNNSSDDLAIAEPTGDIAATCLAGDPDCQDLGGQPTDEPLFIGD
jgi:hypothetical protein